jgi:hypothetical protein
MNKSIEELEKDLIAEKEKSARILEDLSATNNVLAAERAKNLKLSENNSGLREQLDKARRDENLWRGTLLNNVRKHEDAMAKLRAELEKSKNQ